MKNKILNLVALSLCMCANTAVMAHCFPDVPETHWAHAAVADLSAKGIYEGYPSTLLKGDKPADRYEVALIAARCLAYCEQHKGEVALEDQEKVNKLCIEFAEELATMGVRVDDAEYDLISLKGNVSELKNEVKEIKDEIGLGAKHSRFGNVRLSGDMLVHNHNFSTDGHRGDNRTYTNLRLQMDADINDKVSMAARWNLIEGESDGYWHGNNKGTSTVEVANMKIKNVFGTKGDLKLGRDWNSHGHGFIVNNYMDAVTYAKRCGEVDLSANCFFNNWNSANFDNEYYNIWNINADADIKGHNVYMGFYGNHRDRVYSPDSFSEFRMEFGSSGKLSKKNNRFSYDLAGVYSDTESTGALTSENPVKHKDEKGWLGHAAFNYDSQKQLTAKIAYTMADDGSNANFDFDSRQDYNSWYEGQENIFEDISKYIWAFDGNYLSSNGLNFKNLSDIKLQVGYTLKKYDRHNFRLAYDMVKSDKDDINSIYSATNTNKMFHKIDFDMITAEYRYRISPNTRLRVVYYKTMDDSQEVVGGPTCKDKELLLTELYARF